MKKLKIQCIIALILFFLLLAYTNTHAQVVAKTKVQTQESLTKFATKTTDVYQGLVVYKSSKNQLFVIKKSKKTGNYYKVYVVKQ